MPHVGALNAIRVMQLFCGCIGDATLVVLSIVKKALGVTYSMEPTIDHVAK